MTLPRFFGALATLAGIVLIVLAVFAYNNAEQARVLPTGGVTDGGPLDAVPTDKAANESLAARTRMQAWRDVSGPAPGTTAPKETDGVSAAVPTDHSLAAKPPATAHPTAEPWVGAPPSDISLYRDRNFVSGITSLPDPKKGVLLQEAGRDWRRFHNVDLTVGGGIALLVVLTLLGAFLAARGRVRLEEGFSGKTVPRFAFYERANHWMTAVSFIMVALTGLILLYGQFFLRPLVGAGAYSAVASYSVWLHIGFAIPFVLGVIAMAVFWLRQNGLTKVDLTWLKKGGGIFFKTKEKPHAYRFNAGQKLIFWAVVLGALSLTVSGVTLMFPFFWLAIGGMQLTLILHAAIGLAMIAVILGHIYIGTVGMEGAFDAMWSGKVDRNWAREHHDLWVEEMREEEGRSHGPEGRLSPAE